MSDDRDLDELLESLDALLREGGSHNDDAAGEEEPAPARPKTVAKKPVQPAAAAVKAPAAPTQKRDAATQKQAEPTPQTDNIMADSEALPHFLAEPQSDSEAAAASASEKPEVPEPALENRAEATGNESRPGQPTNRVVLTEDMLIGNHQASLPLGQKAVAGASQPHPSGEAQADALHPEIMERLVAEVFQDVSDKLQTQLPVWIEQAIRQRLHMLKATDQKKEQDNE